MFKRNVTITKVSISLVLDMIETSFKNGQTQDNILYNIFALFYIRGPRVTANIAKILQQQKFPSLQYLLLCISHERGPPWPSWLECCALLIIANFPDPMVCHIWVFDSGVNLCLISGKVRAESGAPGGLPSVLQNL